MKIEFTIVEPGAARTSFASRITSAPPMAAYDDTPSGTMRRMVAAGGFAAPVDPAKIARGMINSVDRSPEPRRLALGSDAYAHVRAALVDRLAALDAQSHSSVSRTGRPMRR